jgi:hypothetical protein
MTESSRKSAYSELRQLALNTTAETLEITLEQDRIQAFGVVIDIGTEEGFGTFVAFRTGDTSMYTSGGGGIIGGIGHERVRNAAVALVQKAETRINDMEPTTETPLPAVGFVHLYVLTNKGKYYADDTELNFFTTAGKFADLSAAANEMISELREIDENR